jgi:predicted phosphodiesterase
MRIIGDVHSHFDQYIEIANQAEYSVQVGDVGINYYSITKNLDPNRHNFVLGNHDNYDRFPVHALSGFGMKELGGQSFFYIHGAYSIDKAYLFEGMNWWPQEEMTWQEGYEVIELIKQHRPKLIISHDCPFSVYSHVLTDKRKWSPSKTAQILDAVFEAHKPECWVFGHHHFDTKFVQDSTTFVCLDELSYIDYPDLTIKRND